MVGHTEDAVVAARSSLHWKQQQDVSDWPQPGRTDVWSRRRRNC